jgi:hypothetical protein
MESDIWATSELVGCKSSTRSAPQVVLAVAASMDDSAVVDSSSRTLASSTCTPKMRPCVRSLLLRGADGRRDPSVARG